MRIRGINRLEQAARRFGKRFIRSAVILVYHRVAESGSDPQLLCVTQQHFAEHLKILREHYRPIRLEQLVQGVQDGNLPQRSVVLTFDDGYADNLYNAKPLLERYDIPAAVFVTTGNVESKHGFWWDTLEHIFFSPRRLQEELKVTIAGKEYLWHISDHHHYTPGSVYEELYKLLRPLNEVMREEVLSMLSQWAGISEENKCLDSCPLTAEEILPLVEGGLIELGAHSVTHPVLATLSIEDQYKQISKSRQYLEELTGRSIKSFSYPYGTLKDVSKKTIKLVRACGFNLACANYPQPVTPYSNLFWLPRFLVRNWDGDQFVMRLREWFKQ